MDAQTPAVSVYLRRGLSTDNQGIPLSDGALIILTTSVYADRMGQTYGDRIYPDELVEDVRKFTFIMDEAIPQPATMLGTKLRSGQKVSIILFSQPLHSDLIQLKDDIRVVLDQRKDSLTRTQPPIVTGVIGILHLFALGETLEAADHKMPILIKP